MTTLSNDNVPLTTQLGHPSTTQSSQNNNKIVLVYHEKMSERQHYLMEECKFYLKNYLSLEITHANKLAELPTDLKLFLIPGLNDKLTKDIRDRFSKSMIFLPRPIIEKRDQGEDIKLPTRKLVVSLTMRDCNVFLVQSYKTDKIKKMILEMNGLIITKFDDNRCNVMITDRADNKYCAKAFKRGIPVVPAAWVDENYSIALDEDDSLFRHNALTKIDEHRIKPFFGLKFNINARLAAAEVKQLIVENQGSIIYGTNSETTHIVVAPGQVATHDNETTVDFLKLCARYGYYLTKQDYRRFIAEPEVLIVKKEVASPPVEVDSVRENSSPRLATTYKSNCYANVDDSDGISETNKTEASSAANQMLPPPPTPQQLARPLRQQQQQQPDNNMDDMILKAMSTLDTVQTQQASTQMRRLPDQKLQIEQTIEPSQALWWNDKRN